MEGKGIVVEYSNRNQTYQFLVINQTRGQNDVEISEM